MDDVVMIGGLPIRDLTYSEVLDEIEAAVHARQVSRMTVTNASKTILAQTDGELRSFIQGSQIVTADGMSVVWAARFLGFRLRERVTGIDTMDRLIERANEKGHSVFFLGAKHDVVETVARLYQTRYPSLRISGFHDGYFANEIEALHEKIRSANPDILFVAMGTPAQEKWIAEHQVALGVPFCIGVGGSFDHVAGISKRAPGWMQKTGLEWFYRLISEPRRLWRRYLVGNTKFICLVLCQRLTSK